MNKDKNVFCDSCGKILEIKTIANNQLGICSCGFIKRIKLLTTSEKMPEKDEVGEGVAVEIQTHGFPNKCKKCGYGECDVYDLGASYSDESDVYLYRCKKCGYVERQADGSGNK